jgi:hypothetical protein
MAKKGRPNYSEGIVINLEKGIVLIKNLRVVKKISENNFIKPYEKPFFRIISYIG